jgi:2-polyprenyl-3-methyl-5-hydroxy-6-metoxy-1,4-benzoquinol methylase
MQENYHKNIKICPVCRSSETEFIYQLESAPMQNKIYDRLEDALRENKVKITLWGCKNCSFVFNADFNPENIDYSSDYDNTQEYSQYFLRYIKRLGKRLIKKYDLKNKSVVEVGCGKGGFLKILYQSGVKNIKGFDPSYVDHDEEIDNLVIKKYFSPDFLKEKVDFVVCRHVLEHIPNPYEFVNSIVSCLKDDGVMYFEFPSLEWIVKHKAFFDFYYEHCNYFTKDSVITLFRQFGFTSITINFGLKGQYFQVEMRRDNERNSVSETEKDKEALRKIFLRKNIAEKLFREISDFLESEIRKWKDMVEKLDNFVVWGAGAKGITFLNRLNIPQEKCRYVIDINPKKHNKFVPITGQKIVSPQILMEENIKNIIVMNPAYKDEIISCAKKYGFQGNFIILE